MACKQDKSASTTQEQIRKDKTSRSTGLKNDARSDARSAEDREYTSKDLMASGKRGNVLHVPPQEKKNMEDAFRIMYEGFVTNADKIGKSTSMSMFSFNPAGTQVYGHNPDEIIGLAAALKDNPNVRVQIHSHSNSDLSITHARANAVKQLLIEKGVPAGQISSMGKGRENAGKAAGNLISVKLLAN